MPGIFLFLRHTPGLFFFVADVPTFLFSISRICCARFLMLTRPVIHTLTCKIHQDTKPTEPCYHYYRCTRSKQLQERNLVTGPTTISTASPSPNGGKAHPSLQPSKRSCRLLREALNFDGDRYIMTGTMMTIVVLAYAATSGAGVVTGSR